MKKLISIAIGILFVIGVMAGCSSNKLSDNFNETDVKTAAEGIIDLMNTSDFATLINDKSSDTLKSVLTEDALKSAKDQVLGNAGEFQSYKSETVLGEHNKKTDEDSAVAVIIASYKNLNVTYTISFDKDMKLNEIYMK